ncbi:MAG: LysR family transcriptional regulator [Burkholderiaceae bacterium]|nr:LysR family transcriptional regulator [Burkholderiaceae bacterium]
MTLIQLRHLIALAESGSFSRSAEACFVTQSALSRSIRALEDEFGQALFDRIGRRAELTTFGAEVLQRARGILFETDELRACGPKACSAALGRLRLGMASGPAALLTTPLLLHMSQQHPALRTEIARGDIELLAQGLRRRALDALVIEVRAIDPAPDLKVVVLAELPGAFMCRRGHPLLRRRGPVRFDDLLRYPLISTPLGDEVARSLVGQYGSQAHPEACITQRSEDIANLADVARQSDAVLLAVRAAAPGLAAITLSPPVAASASFGLVTLARRSEAPALPAARQFMQQVLRAQATPVTPP